MSVFLIKGYVEKIALKIMNKRETTFLKVEQITKT